MRHIFSWRRAGVGLGGVVVAVCSVCTAGCAGTPPREAASRWPWAPADELTAKGLVAELQPGSGQTRTGQTGSGQTGSGTAVPVVVYVGPRGLFSLGHVPGSFAHGPAASPEGLSELKAWAATLPKSANVVVYCGCCPLGDCPNLQPAFAALKDAGVANVRVLALPNNFNIDWMTQGYPVEK